MSGRQPADPWTNDAVRLDDLLGAMKLAAETGHGSDPAMSVDTFLWAWAKRTSGEHAPGGGLRGAALTILRKAANEERLEVSDFEALRAALAAPAAPDLARWLQEWAESQPAITIRRGVEPQVAWRALADELLRRWG